MNKIFRVTTPHSLVLIVDLINRLSDGVLNNSFSTHLVDIVITEVVQAPIELKSLEEQVNSIAFSDLFKNFIVRINTETLEFLLKLIRELLMQLYNENTIYNFTNNDIVTAVNGQIILITRT